MIWSAWRLHGRHPYHGRHSPIDDFIVVHSDYISDMRLFEACISMGRAHVPGDILADYSGKIYRKHRISDKMRPRSLSNIRHRGHLSQCIAYQRSASYFMSVMPCHFHQPYRRQAKNHH